jgi:hypothetical protein
MHNPMVNYRIHKSPSLKPVLMQIDSVRILVHYFRVIYFFLKTIRIFLKFSLSFRLFD